MDSDNGWEKGSRGRPGHLQNPSNVTRITRAIKSEDDAHHPQIVYYQSGIGTQPGWYDRLVGGGTGMGLSENIREAYAFLASNYSPEDPLCSPDSIFLLGFSRGAFTARSLGGFIAAVGILHRKAMPFFYECYLDYSNAGDPSYHPKLIEAYIRSNPDQELKVKENQPSTELAHSFKDLDKYLFAYRKHLLSLGLTQEVKIQCIGVWDTVGALGIPINPVFRRIFPLLPAFIREYRWFDTRLDNCIENAFQALALDEHRFPFSPAVWEMDDDCTTNLKQVWFPGAHSNIGGSYDDYGIANITLAWMMDQLAGNTCDPAREFKPRDWIKFDEEYIDWWNKYNGQYYAKHPKGEDYRGWGMGKVYESDTFPESFLGATTREPGMYHKTDYKTGKQTDKLLRNTNEYIHSSIRARIDLAGREVEPEQRYQVFLSWLWRLCTFQSRSQPYQPQRSRGWLSTAGPLNFWRLQDGHGSHRQPNLDIDMSPDGLREINWLYEGKGNPCSFKLPEDKMAEQGFEQRLLLHDQEIAKQVIFSNNHWHWFKKPIKHPHIAHTF